MKILHSAYTSNLAPGVVRQMEQEQDAADSLAYGWSSKLYTNVFNKSRICVYTGVVGKLRHKISYYKWLNARKDSYNILLLRYTKCDPLQYIFLRRNKKRCLLVHHTLEGPQILTEGGSFARIKKVLEDKIAKASFRHVDGLVAVTQEIADYQIARSSSDDMPVFIYPNGIRYLDSEPNGVLLQRFENPQLLFVASQFVNWHGLDILFDAVQKSNELLTINVVGKLDDEQIDTLKKDSRFIVHGMLEQDALNSLAAKCDLGLGSFGFHRKSMRQACTLKVREYLLAGLPVYSGQQDVFDDSVTFYKYGTCNIDSILEFLRGHAGVDRSKIAMEAKPWIDKDLLLKGIYNDLQRL